jgi:hypothetical protein
MLNAIMEIRNEIYNAHEYGRSALSKKRAPMKKTRKKTPKGAANQYLNQTTPQTTKLNLKESTDAQKLKDMDKLMSNSVSRNGSVARYKGPKYIAIQSIFTYLACTTGLGFSAVAILQSVFNDTIKNQKQKIKQAIKARNLQYDLNKTTHRRVLHTEEHTTHEQIFGAVPAEVPENIQTIPSTIDTETTQQLLKQFQLIRPGNLFPPDLDLSDYIMLAYTKEYELLMSKPSEPNKLPNYAIYLGHFNTLGNKENNYITGYGTDVGFHLDFNDSPLNTIAVKIENLKNYDEQYIQTVVALAASSHKSQILYKHLRKDKTTVDWYVLIYMTIVPYDICAICLENIETIDPRKTIDPLSKICVTKCKHMFHKICLQTAVDFQLDRSDTVEAPCPTCRQPLELTVHDQIHCHGQAAKGFDESWVTHVMKLERNMPILLKDYNGVTAENGLDPASFDVDSSTISELLKDFTVLLKEWFVYPNYELQTNDVIALLMLLYKYCLLIVINKNEIENRNRNGCTFLAYVLYEEITNAHLQSMDTLKTAVSRARDESNVKILDTLELEIERNRVFIEGLPIVLPQLQPVLPSVSD